MYKRLNKLIATPHEFPCVSIIIPTQRSFPDKTQAAIRAQSSLKVVAEKLSALPQAAHVIRQLHHAMDNYDFTVIQDALIFLAHETEAVGFATSGACDETISIGSEFALNELCALLQDEVSYWVLILGKEDARLCRAENDTWTEIITPERDGQGNPLQGFPLNFLKPDDKNVQSVGRGYLDARYKDHHERTFFEFIDRELHKVVGAESLPVVLCADAKAGEMMQHASKHQFMHHVVYDGISQRVPEIALHVWPHIKKAYQQQHEHLMLELESARNTNHVTAGLQRVWEVILDGRVKRLFVERGSRIIGRIDPANQRHVQVFEREEIGVTDNLVDVLIAATMRHNGEITVVPQGTLRKFNDVAALLRY
jgi:hypothetical protein